MRNITSRDVVTRPGLTLRALRVLRGEIAGSAIALKRQAKLHIVSDRFFH